MQLELLTEIAVVFLSPLPSLARCHTPTGQPQVFEYFVAEHLIDTSRRVYCPYKDCSVLLERPEPEEEMVDAAGNQEAPYECPSCHRQFCLSCGVTGWHVVSRDKRLLGSECDCVI